MSDSNKLGSSCLLIVAIVAMLALPQPSNALNAQTANAVCNLLMDGINIFSGSSCDQYYSCAGGLATLLACEAGYYFSRESQSCLLASTVSCTIGETPCANIPNGQFISVPNSCTNFYYCNNGVAQMGTCPNGLNFDPISQSCNYTVDYLCNPDTVDNSDTPESINYCSVVPNGYFFGSANACNSWQECRSNGLVTGVCPSPFFFNVETGSCDYQDNVSCRQTNGVPTIATGSLAGTSCSDNGAIVSDNQTCTGYYTCTNNAYVYSTCVGGLYFNPPTGACVNRVDAINNCNRCEGTTLQFVNLYQDNCVGYASCSNGREVSTGTCPSGAYFNENQAACVEGASEPLLPVCNVAMDSTTTAASGSSTNASSSSDSTTSAGGSTTVETTTGADATTTETASGDTTTVADTTPTAQTTTVETTTAETTTDGTTTDETTTTV